MGKYQRTQGNLGTMSEKRSYPSEYRRRDHIWVSTGEYKTKRIVSGQVQEKGPSEYQKRVRASSGKGVEFGRVLDKGPGEYRRKVESGRVQKNPKKKLAKHNNTKKEGVCPSMNMRMPLTRWKKMG